MPNVTIGDSIVYLDVAVKCESSDFVKDEHQLDGIRSDAVVDSAVNPNETVKCEPNDEPEGKVQPEETMWYAAVVTNPVDAPLSEVHDDNAVKIACKTETAHAVDVDNTVPPPLFVVCKPDAVAEDETQPDQKLLNAVNDVKSFSGSETETRDDKPVILTTFLFGAFIHTSAQRSDCVYFDIRYDKINLY